MPEYTHGLPLYDLPTTMAAPPTVAVGSANGASQIASSVLVPASDDAFRYYGGTVGDDLLNIGYIKPDGLTPSDDSDPLIVDVVHTGTTLEFLVKTAQSPSTAAQYRILVDGQEESGWRAGPAYGSNAAYLIKVTFASAATRRIELEFHGMRFGGIRREATASVAVSDVDLGPRVTVLGDSWTRGGGALRTLARTMGLRLHWYDVRPSGLTGTGFVTPGGTVSYLTRVVADVTARDPDLVLIIGGLNDIAQGYDAGPVGRATTALVRAIKAVTGVPVAVAGPQWSGWRYWSTLATTSPLYRAMTAPDEWPDFYEDYRDAIRDGAARGGADLVIDMLPWITGSGTISAPASNGNADLYIIGDALHPTSDAGHDYLGEQLAQALAEPWTPPATTLSRLALPVLPIDALLRQSGSITREDDLDPTTSTGAIGTLADADGFRDETAWVFERGTTNYHPNPGSENSDVPSGGINLGYAAVGSTTVIRDTIAPTKHRSGSASRRAITDGVAPGEGYKAVTLTGLGIAANTVPWIGSLYHIALDNNDHGGKIEAWLKLIYTDAFSTTGAKVKGTLSQAAFQRIVTPTVLATSGKTVDQVELYLATDADEPARVLRFYGDDHQIEHRSSASGYTAGDRGVGYAWVGDANASASTRAGTRLTFPTADVLDFETGFVFVTFRRDFNDIDSTSHFVWSWGTYGIDDFLGVRLSNTVPADVQIYSRAGAATATVSTLATATVATGTVYDLYVAWDGDRLYAALNGSNIKRLADRIARTGATPTGIDIGSLNASGNLPGAVGAVVLGNRLLRLPEIDALRARERVASLTMLGDVPATVVRVRE